MGRIDKVDEDATPAGILAFDPPQGTDLELLLTLLGRQADEWRQELEQLQRSPDALLDRLAAYDSALNRVQQILNEVSELRHISSGDSYKRNALQKMQSLKELAAADIVPSGDLLHKDDVFFQTRSNLFRTLLGILDEFV